MPVIYKGEELLLPAQLLPYGYTHRFQVEVNGQVVFFERDEEQNYRAIIDQELNGRDMDKGLLKAIAESIQNVLM